MFSIRRIVLEFLDKNLPAKIHHLTLLILGRNTPLRRCYCWRTFFLRNEVDDNIDRYFACVTNHSGDLREAW
jgi:hypothetical protein